MLYCYTNILSFLQLSSADDDVIDGAISILKAIIFGTNHLAFGHNLTDTKQMNSMLPLLLNLLDERDATAKAVVTLIAEYCSMYVFLSFKFFYLTSYSIVLSTFFLLGRML